MALPPGTSGWLGSGFDCTCDCMFHAGFRYGDEAGGCLLRFEVNSLKSGCTSINFYTADVTVVFKKNGATFSDSLTPYTDSSGNTGGFWELWKPTANDVYAFTVTLDCTESGGSGTYTKTFTFTVPDPANTSCSCCSERVLDYVVVSGLTGPASVMNGTYAFTSAGLTFPLCGFDTPSVSAPSFPSDPCGLRSGSTFCGGLPSKPSALYQCCGTLGAANAAWYYYGGGGTINGSHVTALLSLASPYVDAVGVLHLGVTYAFNIARYRQDTNTCNAPGGGTPPCGCPSATWLFEINCRTGRMTYKGLRGCNTTPLDGSVPTVDAFFIDL